MSALIDLKRIGRTREPSKTDTSSLQTEEPRKTVPAPVIEEVRPVSRPSGRAERTVTRRPVTEEEKPKLSTIRGSGRAERPSSISVPGATSFLDSISQKDSGVN